MTLGSARVFVGWHLLVDALVGAFVVVMPAESIAEGLQLVDAGRGAFLGVEVFEGAVVALELAAGLGMARTGFELLDAQGGQSLLKMHRFVPVAGDELLAVVTDELARGAVFGHRGFHRPPGGGHGESRGGGRADGVAGVVVKDVDHPRQGAIRQGDLGAVDLP